MRRRLAAARVLAPRGLVEHAAVDVEDGRVVGVEQVPGGVQVPDRTLAPGFVDLQVNGLDDVDVAEAGERWPRIERRLAAGGVTTWCPTLVTAPLDAYPARFEAVAAAADRPAGGRPAIAGVHLEGPFLGARPGAHPVDLLRPLDLDWLAALPDIVRLVTLAPELEGAPEAVRRLRRKGMAVSLGHSAASPQQVVASVEAGATLVTHVFNGMPPLHHRDPGLAGSALLDDRLTACVIGDGVHVAPAAVALVFRCKPAGRVALVSDAIAWRAREHAGSPITLVDGAARLPDGTLAGSAITLDAAVRTAVAGGVPVADALVAASATPAEAIGCTDRGRLVPGARADLVALGPDLCVEATWVGGAQVHG
jgi:N-acetylglucosamine-6-phosphate deacetylase